MKAGIIAIALVIISFLAGFITQREMTQEKKEIVRDTLVFKSYHQDSIRLYVVLKEGKLQSFWYSKVKKWTIQPTMFK